MTPDSEALDLCDHAERSATCQLESAAIDGKIPQYFTADYKTVDRPLTVDPLPGDPDSATVLTNTFDGDGARLIRVASGAATHYVGDWFEFNLRANTPTAYYPFNGKPVAMKSGATSTITYLHQDHLGSLVSATNTSGTEVASARYYPFGSLRLTAGTLPTDRLFTGQIRDLGDDRFYWFKSRYYDATIGKFQSPDPVPPDPKIPQGLNHYAYANNNPLRYRDSTGHMSETPPDMLSPAPLINVAPPAPPNQPLIFVAPQLPGGPLIFTGQLNTGTRNITVPQDLGLNQPVIQVQPDDLLPTIFAASRKKLRDNLGGKDDDGMQAHHIIPVDFEDDPLVQRAISACWDIDSKKNGILLPESAELAEIVGLPQHRGQHREYNAAVDRLLGMLSELARDYDLSDTGVKAMLDYSTALIKQEILKLPWYVRLS